MNFIVLKNVGRIGGDDSKVKARLSHILSTISRSIKFRISEVRTRGVGSRPPIYEVGLEDEESAVDLQEAFRRFSRKRDPVKRPPELDGVQVFNSATLATRVRVSILRVSWSFFVFSFSLVQLICLCFQQDLFWICFCFFFSLALFYICFLLSSSRSRLGTSVSIQTALSLFRLSTLGPASGSRPQTRPRPPSAAITSSTRFRSSIQWAVSVCSTLISRQVFMVCCCDNVCEVSFLLSLSF